MSHSSTLIRVLVVCCFVVLGVGLWERPCQAGPWSQNSGHFYVKASQAFMFGKESILDGKPGGGDFFGSMTALYGEVGIYYGLQFQFLLPYSVFRVTRSENEFYQLDSFLDSIFGVQWTPPFLQKALGFPIALRFNTKVPLYDQGNLTANEDTQRIVGRFPILGEGQLDFTLWLSVGGSIPKTNLYLYGEVGYRIRTNVFLDQRIKNLDLSFLDTFVFNTQVGYFILQKVLVMLNFNGAIPIGSEPSPFTKGFVGIGLGLYIPVWKGLAVEAGFDHMLWSVAAPPVTSFNFGLSYKF
ncbi:MAG: hypothetical protein EP343_33810 [Deltaproteobacteria bacterium]|nr:MAG: hypothetical protein EP343_33810 [Deltaproteobacteria bacterium]